MKNSFSVCLCFLLFLTLQCKKDNNPLSETESKEFIGTSWKLFSIQPLSGETLKPLQDQTYSIQFLSNGTFQGTNDCNDLFGTYEKGPDQKLIILQVGGSKMNCPNSIFKDYLTALSLAQRYKIYKNTLCIHYGDNSKLNFVAE